MNIPSIWNLFVIQLLNMLISMLVLSLARNGFEMIDISSDATTFKIWELTS